MTPITNLNDLLDDLEIPDREQRVYATLLKHGGPASTIASRAGLSRTNAYAALENLENKGLIYKVQQSYGKFYRAEDPQSLVNFADNKRLHAMQIVIDAKSVAQSLRESENLNEIQPKVRSYVGILGLKNAYSLILETRGNEIIALVPMDFEFSPVSELGNWFIERRLAKQIKLLCLEPRETFLEIYEDDPKTLRSTRIAPDRICLENSLIEVSEETIILANWIDKELHTIVITHSELSTMIFSILKLVWENSENIR